MFAVWGLLEYLTAASSNAVNTALYYHCMCCSESVQ